MSSWRTEGKKHRTIPGHHLMSHCSLSFPTCLFPRLPWGWLVGNTSRERRSLFGDRWLFILLKLNCSLSKQLMPKSCYPSWERCCSLSCPDSLIATIQVYSIRLIFSSWFELLKQMHPESQSRGFREKSGRIGKIQGFLWRSGGMIKRNFWLILV